MFSNQKYKVIGVMSGTSLDGVDLALCQFQYNNDTWSYAIEKATTTAYTMPWRETLQQAVGFDTAQLEVLNKNYTLYLAEIIQSFISENQIQDIDAVCSHGHTILHQPDQGLTLQIGNLQILAEMLQQQVVCDFRVQDVAMGGQGAPLVPIGDLLLFSDFDYCVNLGGFANISFQEKGKRLAYDICPVNIVMNLYAEMLGKPYDENGAIAASGNVNATFLDTLNTIEFYKLNPPKSLGLEWVQKEILPLLKASKLSPQDILGTSVAHIATQIANQLAPNAKVLLTGGGAYNDFLLSQIKRRTTAQLLVPDATLLEFKEALIFGFLGVLKMRGEVNCLGSVTGASKDHSSGVVFKK